MSEQDIVATSMSKLFHPLFVLMLPLHDCAPRREAPSLSNNGLY